MLNIADELKTIYRNDLLPIVAKNAPKDLEIHFPSLGLYILTDQIVDGSFELNEKLCSEDDLVFGSCEASQIKFTVADVAEDLTGLEFTINQIVNDIHVVPLGKFKVDSCKKQDDLRFKDIIAYDAIKSTDINVADWYNGLFPLGTETYTLKQFRSSLLAHLGIMEKSQTLPNDDMVVEKTIDPTQISGRDVLKATVELNGAFGHINREGKFVRKILQPGYGDYPTDDYPQMDYPVSELDTSYLNENLIDENISKSMYQSVRFEEYTVKEIDKLQIRAEENDIGAIVGTGTNAYVIEGNFLVFGKSASELEQIATNIYGYIAKRPHRPYEAQSIGLPYIEVGDSIEIATDDAAVGYVLQRTLTGIQALRDTYIAKGNEEREQNFGVNKEIIQLQGRTAVLRRNVDEVSNTLTDLEADTESRFTQTAEQIELRVSKNGIVSAINQSAEEIKISASKINLEGYVTITSLETPGSVEIDGGNLKAGTVIADEVRANWVYAGTISGNKINGGTISGVTLLSSGSMGTVTIEDGGIVGSWIYATSAGFGNINIGSVSITSSNISTPSINGYIPITSGNIGSQSVNYATSAGLANEALYAVSAGSAATAGSVSGMRTNQITASNTGYGNIDFLGFDNAAGVGWAKANFAPIGTSDLRLKYDIFSLDDIPDEIFYNLKPKKFKYKTGNERGVVFGLISQQVENNFLENGLNPLDYNLFDIKDVKAYTDDGQYVRDKTHRIKYTNLIPWMIKIIQNQNERLKLLEAKNV